MIFPALFAIVVGAGMIGQWGVSLVKKQVPELRTEPYRIAFHLAGEFLTSLTLIAAGMGLLFEYEWSTAVYLVGSGMLFYTIIVSPGYFAQKGQWAMVALFGLLLLLNISALTILL